MVTFFGFSLMGVVVWCLGFGSSKKMFMLFYLFLFINELKLVVRPSIKKRTSGSGLVEGGSRDIAPHIGGRHTLGASVDLAHGTVHPSTA